MSEKKKLNLGNVLNGLGSSVKEIGSRLDEALGDFDEKVLALIKPLLDVFKAEIKEDVAVMNLAVEELKRQLKEEMEAELKKVYEEIESVGIDLSDLAEFDLDGDGVVEVDEFLESVVKDLKEGNIDWNVFARKALDFGAKELGDDFKDKLKVIEWFNSIAEEYDFDLQKWLQFYSETLNKL